MRPIKYLHAKSLCAYHLNERTTEYGVIAFDNDLEGNISNSFIWNAGAEKYGHVDFYIDKNFGVINSIWLVVLKSEILYQNDALQMKTSTDYRIPLIDIEMLNDVDKSVQWPKIKSEQPIEVSHNGRDVVQILFGTSSKTIPLNDNVHVLIDTDSNIVGLMIQNEDTVPLLIDKFL